MSELKNCPFCGSVPTLVSDFRPSRKYSCQTAQVRCYNCHSEGYIADSCNGETEQTAIDKWNTRTPDPLLEEMAVALGELEAHFEETSGIGEVIAKALQKYRERGDK